MQENDEQRTEAYMKYAEGAVKLLTQQSAKNINGAAGFAGWLVNAIRKP